MLEQKRLIAEFEEQSFTKIIFPHKGTDWFDYIDEAEKNFIAIINTIRKFQSVLLICDDIHRVKKYFNSEKNLYFKEYLTDDTWARDCSALCIEKNAEVQLQGFTFNGWGGKFEAKRDNALSTALQECITTPLNKSDFVLEGGAIDCNGKGTLLTTAACMLNPNRNPQYDTIEITQKLKNFFNAKHILYLNHGYLAGDDTDSHIDTLARFLDKETIAYVQCNDKNDEHYHQLQLMQEELQMIAKEQNLKLISLPMPDACYYDGERLPATYANFLFVNGALLVPTYNVKQDEEALAIFRNYFSDREIIGIDCSVLIRQHGSLHCVTMNFATGVSISC